MDHALPLSRGGAHTATNVVPACTACNSRKRDKTAGEYVAWLMATGKAVRSERLILQTALL